MKTTLFALLVLAPAALVLRAEDVKVQKVYDTASSVTLKVASGTCQVSPSPDGRIHVDLTYTYDKADYQPTFEQSGDSIELGEKFLSHSARGRSSWTLRIPDGLKLKYSAGSGGLKLEGVKVDLKGSTGSGSMDIRGAKGSFHLSSGSGNHTVSNCEVTTLHASSGSGDHELTGVRGEVKLSAGSGRMTLVDTDGDLSASVGSGRIAIRGAKGNLKASTGSGSIRAENITLTGKGAFSSGSGDVDIDMPEGQGFTLKASAGSGDATVRLNGKAPQGFFQFSASKRSGSIVSPERFDKEEEIPNDNGRDATMKKSFTRGGSGTQVFISTGSGKAELSK